jgi:hypothetical protein
MSYEPDANHRYVDHRPEVALQQPHYVRVPFELLAPAAEAAAVHQLIMLAARLHDIRRS